MQNIIIILLMISFWVPARAAILTTDEAARLLKATEIGEDGGLSYSSGEAYSKLPQWIKNNDMIEVIHEFLGRDSQNEVMPSLVHLIAKYSSDKEFLQVDLEVLRSFSAGKADEMTLHAALMPHEDKSGILDVNFCDERVATALRECLKKLPHEAAMASNIRAILSGEGARNVLENDIGFFPARYMPLAAAALRGSASTHGRPAFPELEGDALHSQGDLSSRDAHGSWPLIGKNDLWLWLLAIPVILFIWLVLRYRK